jgi:hypothetical protein
LYLPIKIKDNIIFAIRYISLTESAKILLLSGGTSMPAFFHIDSLAMSLMEIALDTPIKLQNFSK